MLHSLLPRILKKNFYYIDSGYWQKKTNTFWPVNNKQMCLVPWAAAISHVLWSQTQQRDHFYPKNTPAQWGNDPQGDVTVRWPSARAIPGANNSETREYENSLSCGEFRVLTKMRGVTISCNAILETELMGDYGFGLSVVALFFF